MKYINNALQILQVRKEDSDLYFCSALNLLGRAEKKTMLVVVSLPQFTIKPPSKIDAISGCGERLIAALLEIQDQPSAGGNKGVNCQLDGASRSVVR